MQSIPTWRPGYCYLNKGECNLIQSKNDSFVERVAKNNSWNKIHEIFLINCSVFVITKVWRTIHSSAMTQIKARLMEKHCYWLFPGNSPCFSWLNKEAFWPLRYLETFFTQITKYRASACSISFGYIQLSSLFPGGYNSSWALTLRLVCKISEKGVKMLIVV